MGVFLSVLKESPVTWPARGVSHYCVWGWQSQPMARGGSQLSAGWGGAGQAQLSRAGCWSHTKPAAGLALLPEHPLTPMIWTEQQHKGRTEDRALYSAWKHTFHSANKLLLKSHLTGSGVIAVGAVPEFRRQEWLCVHLTIRGLIPPTQVSHHCMVLDT